MLRLLLPLLLLVLITSCQDLAESPVSGPGTSHGAALSLQDATVGGSAGFYFLPPLVGEPTTSGTPDLDRTPRIEICQTDTQGSGTCVLDLATYEGADVTVDDDHYKALWSGAETNVMLDTPYRISVYVDAVQLGFADVWFVGNMRAAGGQTELTFVGTERTIPIQFRIEEGAIAAAAESDECDVDGTVILDCSVEEGVPQDETTVTVLDPVSDEIAGLVVIPAGALPENALVIMKHLGDPIGAASIDPGDQIPFFLQVRVTDLEGNDLVLLQDAELVVCQDPSLHVPTEQMGLLKIFRVDSQQQTQILATNVGDARCAGYTGSVSLEDQGGSRSFVSRLRGDLARAARNLLGTQPLRALHGGLNTTMGMFSDFGAVVLESTPIGYGSTWEWSNGSVSGTGASPFSTSSWNPATCSHLTPLADAGTGAGDGPNGSDPWPLGSNTQPSVITLTKEFTLPADATGATVWAAFDNDLRVFVNGTDVTPGYVLGQTNSNNDQGINNDGWLVHENCTMLDAYSFPVLATGVNAGGVNTLEVQARDRGSIGFVDVRVEAILPPS